MLSRMLVEIHILFIKEKNVFYINLGLAVLLVYLGNINSFLFSALYNLSVFEGAVSEFIVTLVMLLGLGLMYAPAYYFTRQQNIQARLPDVIPGKMLIIAGLSLYVMLRVAILLLWLIADGSSYIVYEIGHFIIYPAYILIAVGLYKAYKSLAPENPSLNEAE